MKRNLIIKVLACALVTAGIAGCKQKAPEVTGSYHFVIYQSDSDNTNLSDNPVVSDYLIEYTSATTVVTSLINEGNKYYFTSDKVDYIILENATFGMMYTKGYFHNFAECSAGEIDVSMSMTAINGEMATVGISDTPLSGLETYGFVINGFSF